MSRARAALASLAAAALATFTASAATMTQLVNGPSDIRVAPLVEASWAQGNVGGSPCYNSKTPENCLCGCVATASGQIMRKWQYPTAAARKVTNTLSVNGVSGDYTMLGGPGVSYDWANMPLNPAGEASLTTAQRDAVGTLLYDIGVAAKMGYNTDSSATFTSIMYDQFTETFGYSNAAIVGNPSGTGLTLEQFTQAILPSLDAGMPVLVGIGGANTAHSVICDGYGYQNGELYIHINMGQGNNSADPTTKFNNTWYKFPTAVMNASTKEYTSGNGVSLWPSGEQSYLNPAVYNISPTMQKGASIVSGRVFTGGNIVSGATVVALNASGETVATATSNAKGIYALTLPTGIYTLRATTSEKGARRLATVSATSGARDGATAKNVTIGNQHGIDFDLTETASAVIAAGVLDEKPDEFLEYVESNGSQYIDTGVRGRHSTKADMDFMMLNASESWFLGSRQTSSSNTRIFFCYLYPGSNGKFECIGYGSGYSRTSWTYTQDTRYSLQVEFTSEGVVKATRNGSAAGDKTTGEIIDSGYNLYLFACNVGGTATKPASARCYATKIWQIPDGGTDYVLVRDFVPCRKNGVAGLYDRVNKKIFYSQSGTALAAGPVSSAGLTHRWSFNGNLNDSVGGATAESIKSSTSGVIIPSPESVNYVESGTAVQTGADQFGTYATSLSLGQNLVSTNDVTIEIWTTRRSLTNNMRLFDWGNGGYDDVKPTQYVCLPWNNAPKIWTAGKSDSTSIANCFADNVKYHLTFTVTQDGTSSKYHLVRRNAADISDVKSVDHTVATWTLSNVVGGSLYLGHSQWVGTGGGDERGIDANAIYDEVRIWNGVVPDELLALNAAMGPDTVVLSYDADGRACITIPAGESLPINANTVGSNYTLSGSVTFGAGAKIEFDTANNPAGMSFTAEGGFTGVTADNVADYVTFTSTAAHDVTLNGNTITVKPARLAHRWSFNGNLNDSVGTATAVQIGTQVSISDGAVTLNGTTHDTGAINLGSNLVSGDDVTIEIWGTRNQIVNNERLFDWGPGTSKYLAVPWYGTGEWTTIWMNGGGANYSGNVANFFSPNGERFHICFTIGKDGTSSIMNLVRRKASDISDVMRSSAHTAPNWTLSNISGSNLYLGRGQWGSDSDAKATYDEVRIWNGVVPDALLALNADMGPDTMALKYDENGSANVVVPGGKTLHVNGNTVGNYTLSGSVTLEGGARIEFDFDAAQYPSGMSFAALGGFIVPSGTVEDYVTVPEGYDVELVGTTLNVSPATATSWTGAAGDGDWNNSANWTKGVPTAIKSVTVLASATTMPLTVPADAAYASFTIVGGTLAANTDWSGFATKPVISGNVDLNGHDLTMPSCGIIAQAGAAFSNSAATTNEVRFIANDATVAATEATYIDGIANLATAANARIAIVHSSGDSSGTLNVGAANNHTVFRAESGTVSMTANGSVGMTSGGVGYLDIAGGTVDFCTANDRGISVGGANARAFVNISGGKLRANWIDAGNNDVTECSIVQTGGEVETGINNNGNLWLGRAARGRAAYSLSGGSINVTRGTLDVGNYGAATFTQGGGSVSVGAGDLRVGMYSSATGTYALNDGSASSKYWFLIGRDGTGTFTQNGGTVTLNASDTTDGNWVAIARNANGVGTYAMNGGLLEVGTGSRGGGICVGYTGSGRFDMNGGTVTTPTIFEKDGRGTVLLNGGTIKAAKDGGTDSSRHASDIGIIKNVGNLVFGSNATTIDTDGHNTKIVGCGYETIGGGSLVKAGAGTLTVDTMPPVSTLVVSNGTLALSAAADNSAPFAALAHRWSFNGDLTDSIGGATATTIGSKTAVNYVNGTAVQTGSDQSATYATSLNLGKALSAGESVTLEIWAKRNSLTSGMRLFDWGSANTDYICVSWNDNANVWVKTENRDRTGNPAGLVNGCFANNVNYHLGVTFAANANGTTTIRVVRHNLDVPSEAAKTLTTTFPSCDLMGIIAGNLYLGHSQYSGEANNDAAATYDEVRIWKGVLSDDALALSAQKGADATAADIAAIAAKNAEGGSVTRTLDLAGGTLDMGGYTLTQPSVVLGGGTVQNGTLVVNGTINLKVGDYIVNTGTINLSSATVNLVDPENLTQSFAFIRGGTIVGNPAATNLPKGWKVKKSADGTSLKITKIKGVMLIAY